MEQVGKDLVRRLFEEVFTTQNLAAADEIMAEDYVEHAIAPFGREEPGRVHGPSHAREVVEWLTAQFPDLEMTIESVVAEGDMVAVRVRSAGTNRGKLGGFAPPTNKRFVAGQSHWYRVADGTLCEHWATRDDLSTMLQLGVIQPPGPPPPPAQGAGSQREAAHAGNTPIEGT
jgi:predicted ester cyclase